MGEAENKQEIESKIALIELEMTGGDFWSNKDKAQSKLRELSDLKALRDGLGKYDKGSAILNIISGAGGEDAEDFAGMLFDMYLKFASKKGWKVSLVHENKNDSGGFRNVSVEISGSMAYGTLRNESGVHRLVRISPFDAKKLRHTSFALVEVLPKFSKLEEKDIIISPADLKIEFSRSSGPGGQNVNKRDTAVRIVHIPTGIAVHASTERSQEQNREQAMSILRAKIFKKAQEEKKTTEEAMNFLLQYMRGTKTNEEFLTSMNA
jgi:peptide chain release factor 2